MPNDNAMIAPAEQYAAAYSAHYKAKDLHQALRLYGRVITVHPETQEARDARSQVQNIVRSVVPVDVLHDAQVALALSHFEHLETADAKPTPVTA